MERNRVIKTGLKGKENANVLLSVLGQLTDGIWENSSRMGRYGIGADVKLDNDTNDVLLYVSDMVFKNPRTYKPMTDTEVLNWFAIKVKQVIKIEQNDGWEGIKWNRLCGKKSNYLRDEFYSSQLDTENHLKYSPTVGRAYYVYDYLSGRNTAKYNYAL